MIVQPTVGYYSDRCTSRFGCHCHFIVVRATSIAVIGFLADIGHVSVDPTGHVAKPRAFTIFFVRIWLFDVSNNTLQGPCRALLVDVSSVHNQKPVMPMLFSTSSWL